MILDAKKILEIVDNPSLLDRVKVERFKLVQEGINTRFLKVLEQNHITLDEINIFLDVSFNQFLDIFRGDNFSDTIEEVVDRSFYKFLQLFKLEADNLKLLLFFDSELFKGLNFIEFDKMLSFNERDRNFNTNTLPVLALAKLEGLEHFNAVFYMAEYIFDSTFLQLASDLLKKSNGTSKLHEVKSLFTRYQQLRFSSHAALLIRALILNLDYRDAFLTIFYFLEKNVSISNLEYLLKIQKTKNLQNYFSHFVFLCAKYSPVIIERLLIIRSKFSDEAYEKLLLDLRGDNFMIILKILKLFFI